jgi:hypothetical protein
MRANQLRRACLRVAHWPTCGTTFLSARRLERNQRRRYVRSPSAIAKQTHGTPQDGLPVHSLQTLLAELATLVRDTVPSHTMLTNSSCVRVQTNSSKRRSTPSTPLLVPSDAPGMAKKWHRIGGLQCTSGKYRRVCCHGPRNDVTTKYSSLENAKSRQGLPDVLLPFSPRSPRDPSSGRSFGSVRELSAPLSRPWK